MTPILLFMFLSPLWTCCTAMRKPVDCSDVLKLNSTSVSGVYTIYPSHNRVSVEVYCDMGTDGGRWTVIQRRMDGTVNFYRPWDQYVDGFGEADGEYWLGLELMHKITMKQHELLVEMEDFEGKKVSARYSSFSVGAECDGYKLSVSGFTDGGAGDGLTAQHNNMKFSTFDKDQDTWSGNCASIYFGAFWYAACHSSNLNGVYRWGTDGVFAVGVAWYPWKGHNYSLKSISMKIRPKY